MNTQAMTFEIGFETYTAELVDQYRSAGRPVDSYQLRHVNYAGDREFLGSIEVPRSAGADERQHRIRADLIAQVTDWEGRDPQDAETLRLRCEIEQHRESIAQLRTELSRTGQTSKRRLVLQRRLHEAETSLDCLYRM